MKHVICKFHSKCIQKLFNFIFKCSTEETNDLINKLRTHIKNQTTFLIDLVMNLREEQLSQLNSLSASVQHNQEMIQSCNSGENDIAESMSLPGNRNYSISSESTIFYDFYIKFLFLIFFITVITTDVVDKVDEIEEAIKWTPPSCTIKPVAQTKVKTTKIMQRRNTMCGPGTKTVSSPCSLNSIHVPLSMPSNQFNTNFYSQLNYKLFNRNIQFLFIFCLL